MRVQEPSNQAEWELFLLSQTWSPFLQSWMMGEVYRDVFEEPVRLVVVDDSVEKIPNPESQIPNNIVGICQAIIVPARRGRHLAVMYGPVLKWRMKNEEWRMKQKNDTTSRSKHHKPTKLLAAVLSLM